ncbi:MAG: ABC transporter ATP-binding protein [Sphingobacteriia bacterium]|nr:ABC transporter ATP-binding protein [Sphingobacteriia bacterium]
MIEIKDTKLNEADNELFPFICHFLKKYKPIVITFILLATLAGLWGPLNSLFIKQLIDSLLNVNSPNVSILLFPASLIVINFLVFDNFTWRGLNYICAKYVPIIQNRIITETVEYSLSHSHEFYQNSLSGKISKQITNLVDGITRIITASSANFLRGASLLFSAFITAYFVNPIFCLILVTWFIFFASLSILMSKKLVLLSDIQAQEESIVVGELVDILSNQANIRIFSRKLSENIRMLPFLNNQQKAYTKTVLYQMFLSCIQGGLIVIMMTLSVFFLVYLYGKNLVTIGDFALILGLSMETGHMMWFTMSEINEFNKAVGRCKQSLISLMIPLEILDKPNATSLQVKQGQIIFKDVKFHYQNTEPLFDNKSIEIKAGQKVGLVGYSGSGKSTFINLILRFYEINNGAILIDGQDIRDVTQDSLRQNIAMIPQDPSLFNRSLMENIRYGRIEASDEEVIIAAKKAHAHEFIIKLSQGYDSLVGERGVKLSGGQRQRIAIARAILKNAPILILDEATSQLDSVTENLIQESLLQLMQNKTTIVIAHRLSTLLHMDRILVFDKGKIVEDGTHNELLAKTGLYKKLWDAQVGGFLQDEEKVE